MQSWKRGDGNVRVHTQSGATYLVYTDGRIVRSPGASENMLEVDGWVWNIEEGYVMRMVNRMNGHRIHSTPVVRIDLNNEGA